MMIPEHRITEALTYLAETGQKIAKARALMVGLDKQEKTVLAAEVLKHDGTVSERESRARTSESFRKWQSDYESAVLDYEILKTKRSHEELVIEVWRTESANSRKGVL